MGRTACTEPQCLYKGALYLYLTVELYLYSPYGPYDLYRASVPVQGCALPLPFFYLLQKVIMYIAKIIAKESYSFGTKIFMSNGNGCSDALDVCWKTELC